MKHRENSTMQLVVTVLTIFLSLTVMNPAVANTDEATAPAADVATTGAAEASTEATEEEGKSAGMKIPFDGSSVEAFEKSMEEAKPQMTEAEYITLNNALDYLLVYDLAARRNKEKLYANLDGLTGEEIVDKVKWRKDLNEVR
jgi:hypothetical protein